jgi:GH25 family lysozyme M1 (1,4-beta-N-acetylmuramidase)
MLHGMDISDYQRPDNTHDLITNYSLDFLFMRAIQSNGVRDPSFPRFWAGAAGLPCVRGAYHFPFGRAAVYEADYFVDYVKPLAAQESDIYWLDCESNPQGLSAVALAQWGVDWATRVHDRTGRIPGIYGPYLTHPQYAVWQKHFCAWWWPNYPTLWNGRTAWPDVMKRPATHYWGSKPMIWQHSSTYPVGGPNGSPHDASVTDMTMAELQSLSGGIMPIDSTDVATIFNTRLQGLVRESADPKDPARPFVDFGDHVTIGDALALAYVEAMRAHSEIATVATAVASLTAAVADLHEDVAKLGTGSISPEVLAAVTEAVDVALSRLRVTVDVLPPTAT